MTVNDAPPPDPHEDRLSRARERMATDYEDESSAPRRDRRTPKKALSLTSLLPADKTTRMLTYGAAGLGALLLVGIGGWSLIGHHQSGIPVFGPPAEPIREKPLDPGGMELNGMMPPPVDTEQQGAAHLAPAPEQPNPAALAARYGAAAKDEAPPPAKPATGQDAAHAQGPDAEGDTPEAASAAPGNTNTAADGTAKPLPSEESTTAAPADGDTAAPAKGNDSAIEEPTSEDKAAAGTDTGSKAAATSKPVTTAKPVDKPAAATKVERPAPAVTSGPYGVQLAALNSEDAAHKEWDRLKAISPDLFAGHAPVIEKTMHTNAIFYRLRTRGFDSVASARSFCDSLREHGHACNVLRP
ncbi:SPOR domain-containing protein [Acetobacter conturbans]|uniref:Sporulation protein n=1 Tax=Acetobacter conturbans TaxID=1737472 RepID=A0ABX0JZ43_9PROT|nr:SPOR domain-containing protein [Acetobacter conturbans]NHN88305.1 sporulation protein [Acetobacter conturbans]